MGSCPLVAGSLVLSVCLLVSGGCRETPTFQSGLTPSALPPAPTETILGDFTLTIRADPTCAIGVGMNHVPEEARERVFRASIRQTGTRLDMRLTTARFYLLSQGSSQVLVGGKAEPHRMVFAFSWFDGEWPSVVEQLPGDRALLLWGEAVTPSYTGGDLAGVFSGRLQTYATASVWEPPVATCASTDHEVLLSR